MPKLSIPNAARPSSSRLRLFPFPALAPLADAGPAARRRLRWRLPLCGALGLVPLIIGPVANAQPITGTSPIVSTTADRFAAFVAESAQRFGIPATWIRIVMRAESLGAGRARSRPKARWA
jgi:hypothetical protein